MAKGTAKLPHYTFSRYGFCQKNGKTFHFDKTSVTVLKGWPSPAAWQKSVSKPWRCVRRQADKVFVSLLQNLLPESPPYPLDPQDVLYRAEVETEEERLKREGLEAYWAKKSVNDRQVASHFFESVPPHIVELLHRFTERRWNLFRLLARCPGADELAALNPALCFALANNWTFHQPAVARPLAAARRLIRKRQQSIAGWLGFPANETSKRVLARIPVELVTISHIFNIRRALVDPELCKTLRHLPAIDHSILTLIGFPLANQHIGPAFLHDVVRLLTRREPGDEDEAPVALLRDTQLMARQLNRVLPSAFESIEHLHTVHDRLIGPFLLQEERLKSVGVTSLPPPPYVGTQSIQPLMTPDAVRKEASVMRHCGSSYMGMIARGHSYLYRVVAPVRATLEIRRRQTDWIAAQLRGYANAKVPKDQTKLVVDSLFSSPRIESSECVPA